MICVWCGDTVGIVLEEAPDAVLQERLVGVDGVPDPSRLTFCNADCQKKFHTNLRRLAWDKHSPTCTCVTCLG